MSTWQIIDLDPFAAARAGLPAQVAVPVDVDPAAVTPIDLARYGAEYADAEPDGPLASDPPLDVHVPGRNGRQH